MEKKEIIFTIIAQMNELLGLNVENVTDNSTLMQDLGLSSFDILLLLSEIENKFGVEFSASDLRTMFTVGNVADFIVRALSQGR